MVFKASTELPWRCFLILQTLLLHLTFSINVAKTCNLTRLSTFQAILTVLRQLVARTCRAKKRKHLLPKNAYKSLPSGESAVAMNKNVSWKSIGCYWTLSKMGPQKWVRQTALLLVLRKSAERKLLEPLLYKVARLSVVSITTNALSRHVLQIAKPHLWQLYFLLLDFLRLKKFSYSSNSQVNCDDSSRACIQKIFIE